LRCQAVKPVTFCNDAIEEDHWDGDGWSLAGNEDDWADL
jgi:hypothetical protein